MARKPADITRGGGKNFRVQIEGLRDLEQKFKQVITAADGKEKVAGIKAAAEIIGEAAALLLNATRQNLGAGKERIKRAAFAYNKPGKYKSKRPAALVGVRTGAKLKEKEIYKEWLAGTSWAGRAALGKRVGKRKLARVKSLSGRKIGMSLAAMFERGTSRGIKPMAYFRRAFQANRVYILNYLQLSYKTMIEAFNKGNK